MISKTKLIIIEAHKKGYYINDLGLVFNSKGKNLKTREHRGYLYFSIRYDGKRETISVHRLAAFQKFGNYFNENKVVRHLNGISLDNRLDNIGIGTQSDNMQDIPKRIRQLNAKNANKKYSDNLLNMLKIDRKKGLSYKELGIKYNMGKSMLSYYLTTTGKSKEVIIE